MAATSQKVSELEAQLSAERERAVNGEEHGRMLARQLAEQQQESAQLAKKREGSEAELASQVILSVSRSTGRGTSPSLSKLLFTISLCIKIPFRAAPEEEKQSAAEGPRNS